MRVQVNELAKELGIDLSGLRKTLKALKIVTERCRRETDNKVVLAISKTDADTIRAKYEAKPLDNTVVPVTAVATELKIDQSYTRKLIKNMKIETSPRRDGGRVVQTISSEDYAAIKKSRKALSNLPTI